MEENRPRGVPLSPKSMVDSVADWPLHRVVEHLQKIEKEDKDKGSMSTDCRLFYTSGIRMFSTIVDELADGYGLSSRGQMSRYLSYHGAEIAKQDRAIADLQKVFTGIRKSALDKDSQSITDIQESGLSYSPREPEGKRVSFYVYSSWAVSDFTKFGQLCGVHPAQVAQVYMIRSILTGDMPSLVGVAGRLQAESLWWDRWMKYRLSVLELSVAMWNDE